ncbi:hypothetical protein EJ02DRAFT_421597 [Clathrospora elynae]|uniref:Uncharacterized protein n=1 Tax=Clathrospora elynae TaxID=706981 RepID=A0A6A5SRH6_9PLEO|nr:hypothetical protein EJ02DRAFT_421597 [Clathrospora elynae]
MVAGEPWTNHYYGTPIGYPAMTSNNSSSFTVPGSVKILGVTALTMGLWALALGAAGWTAGGVAAGTFDAGMQAGIGNVVAGSAFAMAQSAAMRGTAAGVVNGVIAGTSDGAAAVAQVLRGEEVRRKEEEVNLNTMAGLDGRMYCN